jgi:hypothetical protein
MQFFQGFLPSLSILLALVSFVLLVITELASSDYGVSGLNIYYKKFKITASIVSIVFLVTVVLLLIENNA